MPFTLARVALIHPDSPHRTDQMEMFTDHEYRTIHLDRATLEATAERIYHPGER